MNRTANTAPYFTVIIPVYNAVHTIVETIAGVLAQTERSFELILIDDGSNDDSLRKMLQFAGQDTRIKLIAQANTGVSAARNNGAQEARGQVIAFCDADDFWHPRKLALHRQLHEMQADCAISYGQIEFLETAQSRRARRTTFSTVPPGDLSLAQIIGENPVCTASNLVVTRDAFFRIGGFAAGMNYAEDQEFLARSVSMGERITGIDELLVGYRLSPDGLSVNLEAMYAGWRELVALHAGGRDMSEAEAIFCRYLARRSLRNGNAPREARRYALRGLSLSRAAFMSDLRRGGATLFAALAASALPSAIRQRVFA